MRTASRLLTSTLLAAVLLPSAAHAASARRPVVLAAVRQNLAQATALGAADPTRKMTVGVLLAHPHPAAEQALLQQLNTPGSANYHAFLTPARYAQEFGVTTATRTATRQWLEGGGLSVKTVTSAGDYWLVQGTAGQLEALLQTKLTRFAGGFVANTTVPSTPVGVPVLDVVGLDTRARYHTLAGTAADPDVGTRTPEELRSIYEHPDDSTDTGSGVSVAILGSGATDQVIKDLHQFDTEHHLSQLPVDVKHVPADGDFSDDSGDEEWNIDMQAVHGMAPGLAKEVMYFSPTLADPQLSAALGAWVNDPTGPPVMNASLGECEAVPVVNPILNNEALAPVNGNSNPNALPVSEGIAQASEPATTMLLMQAQMEGRNLFAASGDNGSSCTIVYPGANGVANEAVPLTSDPASSPFAVGVGGTVLYSDGNTPAARALEYAWTFSGGNASPFITAPDYQQNVPNLNRPCVLDTDGNPTNTGQLCRGTPDVAALSGDVATNGYTIVADGKDSTGGGTSLSSPLWVGMWARILSSSPAGTTGFGSANEAFYRIAKDPTMYADSFFDITTGSNGLNPALTGYDYVTGLGAPRVKGLIKDVPVVSPPVAQPGATGTGPGSADAGTTPAATCTDKIAPLTRLTVAGVRFTSRGLTVRGTASDKGCGAGGAGKVARVGVAVGLERVGHPGQCRFVRPSGRLARPSSCGRRIFLPATGTNSWRLVLRRHFAAGHYRVTARSIDAVGNVERRRLVGTNSERKRRS